MTSSHCSIVPPYVLRQIATAEPDLAPAIEFALHDGAELRHRREVTATRWPQGEPPAGQGIIAWPMLQRVETPERAERGLLADVPPGAGPQRSVHDAQHGTSLPGVLVRDEGDGATGDAAADEAYDGLGATWEVLARAYGRDSLDGRGLGLVATVHYARDYDNAFWDGRQMVFGDGDGVYFAGFTRSVDVIAHELAHGLTQYTSGLTYVGQSGALNESASDVWGAIVRQWVRGETVDTADWLIGAELFTDAVQGVALRSMAAPGTAYDDPVLGRDPQPGHMDGYVVLPHDADHDNGGVHINSGIPNKAFHLFATALGGNVWERAGQVWFDTMTTRGLLPRDATFARFAAATVDRTVARYGPGSEEEQALRAAWSGVGLDVPEDISDAAPDVDGSVAAHLDLGEAALRADDSDG
ncbi:M4 family metallopeptidase [Ornithinimicrobium humiphilum]|uniref:Neutral metalloproteinase n=1 Tax=Ornithinimicrobium humiphilum TaxID=125288 RepID=A0A543KQC3_9MICO|nr:M4 family metallopeptidase [Ornithinimicrobium humiphilum]TQM97258.1 thermolysin metallopeptidase-like protein [Ornithinimicrobium humiphilum]